MREQSLPLAAERGAEPRCSAAQRRRLLAAGAVVAACAVVAFAAGGCGGSSPQPLDCSGKIPHCVKVALPPGAKDCKAATCETCDRGYGHFRDDQGAFCGLDCPISHCAAQSAPDRLATSCASAGVSCQACSAGYEPEVNETSMTLTGNCSFSCVNNQQLVGCAPRSCSSSEECTRCVPGFELVGSKCKNAGKAVNTTFYMYRAQKALDYPPDNCNLASAAGVMWYLHNEVVTRKQTCPGTGSPTGRHNDITRVIRYKVTVFNTQEVFNRGGDQLGHFVQFAAGQCTDPSPEKCKASNWDPFGYMVGCQAQFFQKYYAPAAEFPCVWYSLPGKCPSKMFNDPDKLGNCSATEPGGRCDDPNGNHTCTWKADLAGDVSLNELSGITDLDAFCKAGNYEYSEEDGDKGKGCAFWDQKHNATMGGSRVQTLLRHFAQKYPDQESEIVLPAPLCPSW